MDPLRDKLRQQDWNDLYLRLYTFAKRRTQSTDDARDLAQSAITRLFAFDSKWDPQKQPDVFSFLTSVVNSLAYNARKNAASRNLSIDDGAAGQEMAARLADPNLTPEDAQSIHDIYARRLERLRARLADDPDAARLLELTLEGADKPAELKRVTGMSDDKLQAVRKRMQRAALHVARHPDEDPKEKK